MDQPDPPLEAPIEAPATAKPHQEYVEVSTRPADPKRSGSSALMGVVTVLLVVVLAMQIYLVTAVSRNGSDLDALDTALAAVESNLGATRQQIGDVAVRLSTLEQPGASGAASQAPSSAPAVPGGLPMFQSTQNDPAVTQAMTLTAVSGTEYYSGAEATFAPEDGKARVWLIWAHWCPYCQQELPFLNEWWTANRDRYPNTELVTVTTSIDDTRDNPLVPYLDTQQFPFPVLVDEDLQLALKFGTVAYPYWVITDPDGTVMLRATGLLEPTQIEGLFAELERMASEA